MHPSNATYVIESGSFRITAEVDDGGIERTLYETVGYSGRGDYKNRPDRTAIRGQGPIPVGSYWVAPPQDHPRLGPCVFRLHPFPTNKMFGRTGFYIHGDSRVHPGDASTGCVILTRAAREAVAEYDVRCLTVVPAERRRRGDLNTT